MNNLVSKDPVKNANWVGVVAAVLAFISAFLPFYKVTASAYFVSYSESLNLVSVGVLGWIIVIVTLVAGALHFLNSMKEIKLAALIVSAVDLLLLIITIVACHSTAKVAIGGYSSMVKGSFMVGMYFEIIFTVLMIASPWINEAVVKKYIFKNATTNAQPQAQFGSQTQFNGQPQQPQYNAQAQFNAQPQQPQYNAQAQYNAQPQQPQNNGQQQ